MVTFLKYTSIACHSSSGAVCGSYTHVQRRAASENTPRCSFEIIMKRKQAAGSLGLGFAALKECMFRSAWMPQLASKWVPDADVILASASKMQGPEPLCDACCPRYVSCSPSGTGGAVTCTAFGIAKLRCAGACGHLQRPESRTCLDSVCCKFLARPDRLQIAYCHAVMMD